MIQGFTQNWEALRQWLNDYFGAIITWTRCKAKTLPKDYEKQYKRILM